MRVLDGADIGGASGRGHTDVGRLRRGGVDAQFFSVYIARQYAAENRAAHRALEMIDAVRHGIVNRYPESFVLATTAEEIEAASRQGKIAALMGIEGGHAIEDNLALLRQFFNLSVRYMTLTHSNTNNWADSSGDKPRHGGLTKFGEQVVAEMNRLGMLVDISHVADETFWDVLAVSRAPVFASHSSCRALTPHARNMTDEMIRAMAQKGGVIQINFGCQFVKRDSARPSVEDVLAHIDHAVKVGGVDAVGLGADYDGVSCVPRGLEDVAAYPRITEALLARHYAAEDIAKILGGNMLRLMRTAQRIAASPR
jgi:membrane dipeptidase